jgi:lupus La protein
MKHFQPFEAIVAALRDSDQVELTDNETCVRRKFPLPDNYFKVEHTEANVRSVYLKGFGEEGPRTQFDIEAFFDPYGPTRAVRLRRNDEKHFKGSVFVEFDTEDLAKAFLALDPKPQYEGKDLQVMSKIEYMEKKTEDLKTGRMTSNGKNYNSQRGSRYNNRDGDHRPRRGSPDYSRGGRGKQDDRDWRTRRDEDQKKGFRDDRQRDGRGSKGYGGGRSKAPDIDERSVESFLPAGLS